MNELIKYNDGEIELSVSFENDTAWLSQLQISELFETSSDNVSLHFKNIYKEQELDEHTTTEDYSVVRQEGNRKVKRTIRHYNLDAVICVGYRVSSYKATKFRQWATSILKEYISNGYAIKEVVLVDNYIDESILTLFRKYPTIKFTIITQTIQKQLKLDIEKYNKQYNNLIIKNSNKFLDRFMIIDEKIVYHLGASLKDLGKKVFAFSKIDIGSFEFIKSLDV